MNCELVKFVSDEFDAVLGLGRFKWLDVFRQSPQTPEGEGGIDCVQRYCRDAPRCQPLNIKVGKERTLGRSQSG